MNVGWLFAGAAALIMASCSGPSRKEQIAAFQAGPSQEDLEDYWERGTISVNSQQGNGLLGYLQFTVERRRETPLSNGIYAKVSILALPPDTISQPDYGAFSTVLATIPDDIRVTAYLNPNNPSVRDTYLELGKMAAQRSICVGQTATAARKTPRVISDPNDINKILAANNGRVLSASLDGLNIKPKAVPVVQFPRPGRPFHDVVVQIECV